MLITLDSIHKLDLPCNPSKQTNQPKHGYITHRPGNMHLYVNQTGEAGSLKGNSFLHFMYISQDMI